jgi:hypothetical protein
MMFLKKLSGLLFLIFAFVLYVPAQQSSVEYGQPGELRGVTKIFVDSGFDAERREQIAKEIRKRLPNLEIVARPEESDFHLRFLANNEADEITGTIVKIVGENRVRVLFSFKETPQIFASDSIVGFGMRYAKPNIFAAQFVKLYKKANSES